MNPDLDLVLERQIAAAPETLWRCWTEPALLCQWFCPAPWHVSEAVVEARPGGRFFTRMRGPNGEDMPGEGCILAAEPARRLVWTDALQAGFRPNAQSFMTAEVTFTPNAGGTAYRAFVQHASAEARKQHEDMGFHDGWGTVATQMEALAKTL